MEDSTGKLFPKRILVYISRFIYKYTHTHIHTQIAAACKQTLPNIQNGYGLDSYSSLLTPTHHTVILLSSFLSFNSERIIILNTRNEETLKNRDREVGEL